MKFCLLLLLLLSSLISAITFYTLYISWESVIDGNQIFFGVSFGLNTTAEAKVLIDRVKGYTNLFVVNSWSISTNETALNEVCDYAAKAGLNFIVYFSFISRVIYPWHQSWLDAAKERWGDKFLGVYLFDEPGGKQIDQGGWNEAVVEVFKNAVKYSDAAALFVETISSANSTLDLKRRGIPMFTSDYALYWFDYLAGYDCVFAQFGWNHSRIQHIALCRGAANAQGKDWGVIITWTYKHPPYLESGKHLLEDLLTAYKAGAKYIIVFNYPKLNEYGILTDEHFKAMETFWKIISDPKRRPKIVKAEAAMVLPRDYGWGMRHPQDSIWGLWPPDNLSQKIWSLMWGLIEKYELKLDIIYDSPESSIRDKYVKIYGLNTLYPCEWLSI